MTDAASPAPGNAVDVAVIGGGLIGLGIAWRCAQRGLAVTVFDPAPGSGASWTAAGMLAPVTELRYGEQSLFALNLLSAQRYPEFVEELQSAAGMDVGYRLTGSVVAAWDAADLASLRDLAVFAKSLGHPVEVLTGRELRRESPLLSPGLPGGIIAPDDHQVNNRKLHAALRAAFSAAGGRVVTERVTAVWSPRGRVAGVVLADGTVAPAGITVLAAGAWSRQVDGVPPELMPRVRPVKGQTLRLRLPSGEVLGRVVRGTVRGSPVYLVPREDGELVVGASSEETGFGLTPRAGAVYELLRDAQSLLPIVAEAHLEDVSTSLRPGSPDNAPMIGPSRIEGLVFATGHYRNGVLLTPVTADGVADLITNGTLPIELLPFRPDRFSTHPDTHRPAEVPA
ncbi:glycine oxidase ThiO [Nakamurella panacisegetis]